jgi:tetratricopeptide (TPR) repeat protein
MALAAALPVARAEDPLAERLGLTRATGSLPMWTKPAADAMEDLSEQVHSINPSIMIVGSADGSYGTAFVISKEHRLLATNAHVADIQHRSGQMLAIPNATSRVYEIDQVWYHPGVVRTKSGGNIQFRSADPAKGDVSPLSADVAVLHVAGDEELPEALVIASPDEVEDLFARTVGMIGYPGHDTVSWPGVGQKAQATYRQGVIARATDFFNEAGADSRDRQYLQHTMQSWGGFSGSPIFLGNGHVAALHNSGSTVQNQGRIASLQYGVRVDCLWELLAHHGLDGQVAVPLPLEQLRLSRYEGEDPRLADYQEARDLVVEGKILNQQGKYSEAGKHFDEAIRLMPNYAYAHEWKAKNHGGYAQDVLGGTDGARRSGRNREYIEQLELALEHEQIAFQLDPAEVTYALGIALYQGNLALAERRNNAPLDRPFMRSIAEKVLALEGLTPADLASAYNVYANSHPYAKQAIPWYSKGIEACSWESVLFSNRANSYEALGQRSLAAADRRRAKELQTAGVAVLKAWRMATSPDDWVRNGAEAVRLAQEACRITDYRSWDAVDTLAAAHAEAGNFDEAVHWAAKGLELAPEEEKSTAAARLRSYRNQKPWRQ